MMRLQLCTRFSLLVELQAKICDLILLRVDQRSTIDHTT
jgi:hypothetical protein